MSPVVPTAEPTPALLKVLDGLVDLHVHSGPSPFPRRFNHVEASYEAARVNARAIFVKSHHHNTVMDLLAMASQLKDAPTPVYGGVTLNSEVGGINPSAVAMSLQMGGRIVYGPTVCALQHIKHHSSDDGFPTSGMNLYEKEVSIYDASGEVSADTVLVTRLVAKAGAILTSGHLDGPSVIALFKTAHDNGVEKLILHHPDFILNTTDAEIEEALSLGAYIEHELAMYHPDVQAPAWPIERLVSWINKYGPEKTIISSDLGQKNNPLPVDAYFYIIGLLLDNGISEKDIRQMICKTPAYLAGLEDSPR